MEAQVLPPLDFHKGPPLGLGDHISREDSVDKGWRRRKNVETAQSREIGKREGRLSIWRWMAHLQLTQILQGSRPSPVPQEEQWR
ncbi:hypothetical protein V6N11_017326 [Hibiscus sabdariffa]|uniref:Uncharacterized protein n=1 Tax=Hibiscus sabdariffa TaxID=183260 RepID=A0ABR2TY76_9ROSI